MALQHAPILRNALGNAYEATIGQSPVLNVYTGSPPADCTVADSGTLLVSMVLPSDWLTSVSAGVMNLSGDWSNTAVGAGVAGYFRLYDPTGVGTAFEQGTVSMSGGVGDLILDNINIASGQSVNITGFTRSFGSP